MSGARKEAVIGGPGSGKTTYLTTQAVKPRTLSIDPVGGLRKRLVGVVHVVEYDVHHAAAMERLQAYLRQNLFKGDRPVLVDVSELKQSEQLAFADELGTWMRKNFRDGLLVLDEVRWLTPATSMQDHGLVEFIAKSRNYGVGVTLTGHRVAMMNKDLLGLCDSFRVGRTTLPHDLTAVGRILSGQVSTRDLDGLARVLPTLGPGEWVVVEAAAPG